MRNKLTLRERISHFVTFINEMPGDGIGICFAALGCLAGALALALASTWLILKLIFILVGAVGVFWGVIIFLLLVGTVCFIGLLPAYRQHLIRKMEEEMKGERDEV